MKEEAKTTLSRQSVLNFKIIQLRFVLPWPIFWLDWSLSSFRVCWVIEIEWLKTFVCCVVCVCVRCVDISCCCELKMRLVDCPNCFTSNSDDSTSSGWFVNRSGQRLRRLFRRRKSQYVSGSANGEVSTAAGGRHDGSAHKVQIRRYPVERKPLAKKRDFKGRNWYYFKHEFRSEYASVRCRWWASFDND